MKCNLSLVENITRCTYQISYLFQTLNAYDEKFICQLCSHIFRRKDKLKDHLRGQHGIGEPFICPCGITFRSRDARDRHRKKERCNLKFKN